MIFASPYWLLALLPVAAVAAWAYLRPVRRELLVGSLALWRVASRSLGEAGTRSARRIPPGWALLLAGATLAVLALGEPTWRRDSSTPKTTGSAAQLQISFDALAGEMQPDGTAEIFVRLRNHRDQPFTGVFIITSSEPGSGERGVSLRIPPRGTWQTIATAPDSPALTAHVKNETGRTVASADLRKIHPGLTRLAVLGDVGTILHRYIQSDARVALLSDPSQADVVLAQGVFPPPGAAALVLAPPTPPSGWREGRPRSDVTLDHAATAGDDSVMRDVNAAAMAVRRARPWQAGDKAAGEALLTLNDEALIVRTTSQRDPTSRQPRRVYVAFAITAENTNIEETPAPFVTLLANAIRWLHPAGDARGRYVRDSAPTSEKTRLKAPPAKTRLKAPLELSPWLIVAAMLCWLLGWRRCGRKAV
ncbi:MAG: hypothetical protein JW849_05805 [Phycisphaerae bacterium]|nr:hypothetical protein [Phycisphaerae bacterium]